MANISTYTQEEIAKINNRLNANEHIGYFFTSEDIIRMKDYLLNENNPSIKGLVQYFNAKIEYNRIADLLEDIITQGVSLVPKIVFKPVTETCIVTDGKFTLTQNPYHMDGFYFLNNLVVMKNDDGSYDFFDDAKVDIDTLECTIDTTKDGKVTVSYFVINTDHLNSIKL